MDGFGQYVESLFGSWRALAAPHRSASVVRTGGFIACRHPNAVLNNALVLRAEAVDPARRVYVDGVPFALWCRDDDGETTSVLASAGFRRDVTTCPMRCDLEGIAVAERSTRVLVDVDVALVAELNGLCGDVLAGVPGVRGYASEGFEAALVTIAVGSDANVSFVVTRPDARRRGLATAVMVTALGDCRDRGALTASLQATPMAEQLYSRLGFRQAARLQEWLPPT